MRPIKFRRPLLLKGKFAFFKYWGKDIDRAIFVTPGSALSYEQMDDQQMTGLKDKNGEEIYEGDILSPMSSGIGNMWIAFDDFGFQVYNRFGRWGPLYGLTDSVPKGYIIEVIGNIHENPDLICPPPTP